VQLLSIGHTIASYQNYGTGAYFHHGLDIRAEAGSEVHASAGGKVINLENYEPGNPAYWEIAILDDEGFIWQYHHVDRDTIPQAIEDAFKTGGSIAQGTLLGKVYLWPEFSFGERYNHIHVNVIGKDKAYLNGFAFLNPLDDKAAPEIVEIALLQNGEKLSGTNVSGPYSSSCLRTQSPSKWTAARHSLCGASTRYLEEARTPSLSRASSYRR
jgi:hypothetical protein